MGDELLSNADLKNIVSTNEIYFNHLERQFLSKYAPSAIHQNAFKLIHEDLNVRNEAITILYGIMIRHDIVIAIEKTISDLEEYCIRKECEIKDILDSLSINYVKNDDIISRLYDVKLNCLKALKKIANYDASCGEIIKRKEVNNFQGEVDEIKEIFGDVPIMIYGSAVHSKKPGDIDCLVVLDDFSVDTYHKLKFSYDKKRKIPLSISIIPTEYIKECVLSEPSSKFLKDKSIIVNGMISIPKVNNEWIKKLKLYDVANSYVDARRALLPNELDKRSKAPGRIEALMKLPKMIHRKLEVNTDTKLKSQKRESMPDLNNRDELIEKLIIINRKNFTVLNSYIETLQ